MARMNWDMARRTRNLGAESLVGEFPAPLADQRGHWVYALSTSQLKSLEKQLSVAVSSPKAKRKPKASSKLRTKRRELSEVRAELRRRAAIGKPEKKGGAGSLATKDAATRRKWLEKHLVSLQKAVTAAADQGRDISQIQREIRATRAKLSLLVTTAELRQLADVEED